MLLLSVVSVVSDFSHLWRAVSQLVSLRVFTGRDSLYKAQASSVLLLIAVSRLPRLLKTSLHAMA